MTRNNQQNQNNFDISTSNEDLQKKLSKSVTFHDNLGERYLTISESKLKLCLKDNIKNLEDRRAWQAPAGVTFTVIITLLTSDFKDWLISQYTWQAFFIICSLLSSVWLIITLIKIPRYKGVDDIVEELMPPQEDLNKGKKTK